MSRAFKRIPASLIEHFLDTGEMPNDLTNALEQAVKNCRSDEYDGEAPIEVFITDDNDGDDE